MAERLPVGAARNTKSPTFASLNSVSLIDTCSASADQANGQTCQEPELTAPDSNLLSNGSSTSSKHGSSHNKQGNLDINGIKSRESSSRTESEWVEQDEPGVYITLTSLPGGAKDLKRVRFRYPFFCYLGSFFLSLGL